jgi:hypothetical protein
MDNNLPGANMLSNSEKVNQKPKQPYVSPYSSLYGSNFVEQTHAPPNFQPYQQTYQPQHGNYGMQPQQYSTHQSQPITYQPQQGTLITPQPEQEQHKTAPQVLNLGVKPINLNDTQQSLQSPTFNPNPSSQHNPYNTSQVFTPPPTSYPQPQIHNPYSSPYLTQQTTIIHQQTSPSLVPTPSSEEIKLRNRYGYLARHNYDILTPEFKGRVKTIYFFKNSVYFGLFIYFAFKSTTLAAGGLSNKMLWMNVFKMVFTLLSSNLVFDIYSATVLNKAFNQQFTGMTYQQIESELERFTQMTPKVKL